MTDKAAGLGLFGGTCFNNSCFFETLLMIIIIVWLLRWLFGFGFTF